MTVDWRAGDCWRVGGFVHRETPAGLFCDRLEDHVAAITAGHVGTLAGAENHC